MSISEKAMILSDGFCNDLLVSVYSDIGMPMDKPYTYGFTTPSVSVIYRLSDFNLHFLSYCLTLMLVSNVRLY